MENHLGIDYLLDKMYDNKIIIGKGGFGKVRLGLSLIEAKCKPGDLICVKKSKSFKHLKDNDKKGTSNYTKVVTDNAIVDYF